MTKNENNEFWQNFTLFHLQSQKMTFTFNFFIQEVSDKNNKIKEKNINTKKKS